MDGVTVTTHASVSLRLEFEYVVFPCHSIGIDESNLSHGKDPGIDPAVREELGRSNRDTDSACLVSRPLGQRAASS